MRTAGLMRASPSSLPYLHREPYLVTGLLAFALAVLPLAAVAVFTRPAIEQLLALAVTVVGVAPLAAAAAKQRYDSLEILYPISVVYVLLFGVRAIIAYTEPVPYWPPYDDTLRAALLYAGAGFIALLAGYRCGIGGMVAGSLPSMTFRWAVSSRVLPRIATVYAAGLASRLVLILNGWGIGRDPHVVRTASENILLHGAFLCYLALGAAALFGLAEKRKWRSAFLVFFAAAVPIELAYGFILGQKLALLLPVAILVAAYHYTVRPIRFMPLFLVGVPVALFVFPVVTMYRTVYTETILSTRAWVDLFVQNLEVLWSAIGSVGCGEYLDLAWRSMISRFHGIDSLAVVIRYRPEVQDFQHGRFYALIPAMAFVPRLVWPGKPADFGAEFGSRYLNIPDNVVGIGITHLGDLYANFGGAGIVVGMFVFGVLYRMTYLYLVARMRSLAGVFCYIFVMQKMLFIEDGIPSLYSELLKRVVVLLVVARFLSVPAGGRPHGANL